MHILNTCIRYMHFSRQHHKQSFKAKVVSGCYPLQGDFCHQPQRSATSTGGKKKVSDHMSRMPLKMILCTTYLSGLGWHNMRPPDKYQTTMEIVLVQAFLNMKEDEINHCFQFWYISQLLKQFFQYQLVLQKS